jgi:hypothetical protein
MEPTKVIDKGKDTNMTDPIPIDRERQLMREYFPELVAINKIWDSIKELQEMRKKVTERLQVFFAVLTGIRLLVEIW